jgi:hypothetical protein
MTGITAVAFVATVIILASLAGFIAWLNRNQGHCVHTSHSNVDCLHDDTYVFVEHDHDQQYSPLGHDHDNKYAAIGHDHDGRYAASQHAHHQYVTRDEMDRQLAKIRCQLTIMNTVFAQSPLGILLGILFGGVVGALVGVVLDLTLPRSVFEVHATMTYTVGGQQIVQHLTSYDTWPKWGIVLGCIVVGCIVGGLVMFLVGLIRSRRQSNSQVEEA